MPSCSAPGCKSRHFENMSYHKFPKNIDLCQKWANSIGKLNWKPKATSVLCSKHFREEDIDRTSLSCVRIKENGIPSLFPDSPTLEKFESKPPKRRHDALNLPTRSIEESPRQKKIRQLNKPPLEPLASVLIKEELDVDDDYSANTSETSRHGDDMDYEGSFDDTEPTDPLEECKYVSRDINFGEGSSKEVIPESNYLAKEDNVPTSEKTDSASAVNDGLSTILRIADSLALDINNILTDDLGLNDVSPTQPRSETLKSSEKDATLGELKSKCTELEQKLRIHYLKVMLKKEEELVNIKIEASKVYLQNAKIEAEQKREAHLQKMENLKLEHKLMQLRLEKEAKQNV